MNLTKYAYETLEEINRSVTDDTEIDLRLIKQLIIDQRELWLSRSVNKEGTSSGYDGGWHNYTQVISVPLTQETDGTHSLDCYSFRKLWKSDSVFPGVITFGRRPAVMSVVGMFTDTFELRRRILFSTYDRASFTGEGKFNSTQLTSFLKKDYFWVAAKSAGTIDATFTVEVEAILRDPTEAPGYDDEVDEFPIGKNWPLIQDMVVNKMLRKLQGEEDKLNNSDDR